MSVELHFLGAARTVTGSKHLLVVNERRILLECGLYQGRRETAHKVNREMPVDPDTLDAVVLSHAHIDHSGALPRLVKLGYRGPIHCTEATRDLSELLLRDSAFIQAQDAAHLARRGQHFEPYYDPEDVERTLKQLRGVPYHQEVEVVPGVKVHFLDAGHILGAAIVVLDVDDGQRSLRITFTGDLGRRGMAILKDPEPLPTSQVLITEATYGDRLHAGCGDMEEELARIVREETRDGGRILIPAFSVGRTQAVVMYLGKLMDEGRIPRLPIFVDSPMSTAATKIMARYRDLWDQETRQLLAKGKSPFFFDGVRYVADVEESKSLNLIQQPCVILSASGMIESGRVLHHLKQSITRTQDCVLLVGYQAPNTLGRKLLDGAQSVRIFGEPYAVRCKVREMCGFSAHADWQDLMAMTAHLAPHLENTFIVHAEEGPGLAHLRRLRDAGFRNVDLPENGTRKRL